jgi:membrane-associated phospholipid phosphatase
MTYSAAAATAWARVEANKHYPSDVLAGAAIGHFLTAFIHDSFLGLPEESYLFHLEFAPVKKGALLSVGWSF